MFSSIIAKRKKLILLIAIIFGVSAMLISTALLQKNGTKVGSDITITFKGKKKNSLDKELSKRVQLQERLQETINSLNEVATSTVIINPSDKDIATTASITIKLAQGKSFTPEQQAKIKELLYSWESDILKENITLFIS